MESDGLLRTVREQVGAGRTLPLGGPRDGAWITERAAVRVLREAERAVPGARLAAVRIGLADPDAYDWAAVRAANPAAPSSAMPAGPLRIEAEVVAGGDRPLPRTAEVLRPVLAAVAADRLGLAVGPVDLRFTGLLAADAPPVPPEEPYELRPASDGPAPAETDVAGTAARGVPGVRQAAARWDAHGVRVYVSVDAGHRALDVATGVRAAVGAAARRASGTTPPEGRGPGPAVAVVVADAG